MAKGQSKRTKATTRSTGANGSVKARKRPAEPAPVVAKHELLQPGEALARKAIFLIKADEAGGMDALAEAMRVVRAAVPSPEDASLTASVQFASASGGLLSWDRSQDGRRSGGEERGRQRKAEAAEGRAQIHRYATNILTEGTSPRHVARTIHDEYGISRPRIYRALRDHPSGHWRPKR